VNREDQIVAAYADREAVGQIAGRMGISTDDVLHVVAQEAASGAVAAPKPSSSAPRTPWMTTVGTSLMVLGAAGPCGGGSLWLATYYASAQKYPVESWGYGNLAVGVIGIAIGLLLILAGAILLFANRRRRGTAPRRSS
jgi:hypothetical protein